MKKEKRPALTTAFIMINGIVIIVFLLLSAILIYITATSSAQPGEETQTYLLEEQGKDPALLFLEQKENYAQGDLVLVKSELQNQTVYLRETVLRNEADSVTVESDGMQFQENRENLIGCVVFESPFLGKILSYISNPDHTVTVVVIAAAVFVVVVCLIILTAVLLSRKKKAQPKSDEEAFLLDSLFRIEEEEDFVKDVYQQEIREPVEVASAGDDKDPLSDEELERFRETVLSGSGKQ